MRLTAAQCERCCSEQPTAFRVSTTHAKRGQPTRGHKITRPPRCVGDPDRLNYGILDLTVDTREKINMVDDMDTIVVS